MEETQMKFCSQCGNQMHQRALVCAKCGARQNQVVAKKKMPVIAIIAIIVGIGFVGIAILGILAAIAIPQFATYRERSFNAMAVTDLKNAATSVESYFADFQKYPDSLEQTSFKRTNLVKTEFQRLGDSRYELVAYHVQGRKIFRYNSDNPKLIMMKGREAPDTDYIEYRGYNRE